jgi:MFS transporter, FHS family, glucose/mannose:H+ symporter
MYNRKYVFAAACIGMLIFGIVMAVLGAVLPSVIQKFGIDTIDAGSLFLLLTFGMLLGSVIFGPVVDRYGYKALLVLCTAFIFLGLEGIAFAPSLGLLRLSLFTIGFAGGVINGGTNALVSDISGEGRSSGLAYLGVFFGVGAFGVPFILGTMLGYFSFESLISFVGGLVLLPLLFIIIIAFPQAKQAQGFPVKEGVGLLKETTLLMMGFILFMQSGMEMTVSGWTASMINLELQVDAQQAVLVLSLYWVGLMFARIIMGNILKKVSPAVVLRTCIGIAAVGSLLLISANTLTLAIPGLILVGIGFAACFPIIFSYVGEAYAKLSGTAFSVVLVMALAGGMTYPYVTGILGNSFGLRTSFLIIPLSLVIMLVVFGLVLKRLQKS